MADISETQLLTAKLNSETAIVSWKELEVFFARGQLVVVDEKLDLIEVAAEFSRDNKRIIEQYLNSAQVKQPNIDWVKQNCRSDTLFWALVVAPFVLVQLKVDATDS